MNRNQLLHEYRIRIGCHLDERSMARFDGVAVINTPGGDAILETTEIDQSALHGLLARVRDLNIRLISVQRAKEEDDD